MENLIEIPDYQLKEISDTLRMCTNVFADMRNNKGTKSSLEKHTIKNREWIEKALKQ